jgi:rhodanese-related sulfurtransferase
MVREMRTILIVAMLASAGACANEPAPSTQASARTVPSISVAEVDAKLASGGCTPVDANGTGTRKKLGVVPGAVLLSDSEAFALSELPRDKARELVFYCANTRCSASHEAARRALTAGYTNVKVMDDGIAGWVAAGKRVQTL